MKKYTDILLMFLMTAAFAMPTFADWIDSPTTEWTAITYGGLYPDYYSDQQTGPEDSDIVGTNGVPAFYTKFDDAGTPDLTDGTLAFRIRISGKSKDYWENVMFIGMDANLDGALDIFAGLYKNNTVNLYYPGSGLNISPNTTTIESAFYSTAVTSSNYSFMAVDAVNAPGLPTDLDGIPSKDPTDYFVSFSIDFNQLVTGLAATSIYITEETPISFLAATATQQNSLNQDLNGAPKIDQSNSDYSWEQLGASATPTSPTGEVVPEPAMISLILTGGLTLLYLRRGSRRLDPSQYLENAEALGQQSSLGLYKVVRR